MDANVFHREDEALNVEYVHVTDISNTESCLSVNIRGGSIRFYGPLEKIENILEQCFRAVSSHKGTPRTAQEPLGMPSVALESSEVGEAILSDPGTFHAGPQPEYAALSGFSTAERQMAEEALSDRLDRTGVSLSNERLSGAMLVDDRREQMILGSHGESLEPVERQTVLIQACAKCRQPLDEFGMCDCPPF